MVGFRNQVCIGTVLRSKYLAKCYTTTPALPAAASRRYAIIGGGFAGVAVAYHLSLQATPASPVVLDLFDLAGLVRR